MSNDALRWAFHLPMRDATAKAVLIALADHANGAWTCWPSVARLCQFTALGERTVRRALRRLSASGAIRLVERPRQTSLVTLVGGWRGEPGHSDTPVSVTGYPGQRDTSTRSL